VIVHFDGQPTTNGFGGTDVIDGIRGVIGTSAGTTLFMGANQFAHVANVQTVHGDSATGNDLLLLDTAAAITVDHVATVIGSAGNDAITILNMATVAASPVAVIGNGGTDTLSVIDTTSVGGAVLVSGVSTVNFAGANTSDVLTIAGSGETFVTVSGAETTIGTPGANYHLTVQGEVTPNSAINLQGTLDFVQLATTSGVTATISDTGGVVVLGSSFGDTLNLSAAGGAIFRGGIGDDSISATGNHVTLAGGDGNNTLAGGGGTDVRVSFADQSIGVNVDLAAGAVTHGGGAFHDVISGFDGVIGSSGNDTVTATINTHFFDGHGGVDVLHMDGAMSTDVITVADVAVIDAVAGNTNNVDLTITGLGPSLSIDMTNAPVAHVTFDIAGMTALDLGTSTGTTPFINISQLTLLGGSYDLSFDGTVLPASPSGQLTIDDTGLGMGQTVMLNAGAESGGTLLVEAGAAAETMIAGGNGTDQLSYFNAPAGVTVDVTSFTPVGSSAIVSGTGSAGFAAGDDFENFGTIVGSSTGGNVLVLDAANVNTIALNLGVMGDGTSVTNIPYFNAVDVMTSTDMTISTQSGATVISGAGNDTIMLNGSGNIIDAGAGNDTIQDLTGGNTINGGAGNDVFVADASSAGSTFIGGGGNDELQLGLNTNVTVADVGFVHTMGGCGASFTYVTATHLTSLETFDLSNGGTTGLVFDLIGPNTLDFFDLGGKNVTGVNIGGVGALYFQGTGQYDVTLNVSSSNLPEFDASQLSGGGSLVLHGDPSDTLDYSASATAVAAVITGYDSIGGRIDGFGTTGAAAHTSFENFGAIVTSQATGGDLTMTFSTGQDLAIHLGDATTAGSLSTSAGTPIDITGFNSVHYLGSDNALITGDPNFAFLNGGNETLVGGSGDDTIVGAGLSNEFFDGNGTGASTITDHNALYLPNFGAVTVTITSLDDAQGGIAAGTVGSGSATFQHFYEVSADNSTNSTLDVATGSPVTLELDFQDPSHPGVVDGFGGGAGGHFQFENFQTLSAPTGSTLTVNAGGTITTVDLAAGVVTGCGTTNISGFENVTNLESANSLTMIGDDNANHLTAGGVGDTMTGNGGGDTLTAGGGADEFRYVAASDSFSMAAA
ncbi:MAG: hypothetical protein JO021_17360, partial [Alphaproteobacteria bacterium]|nr:hypothetical protein [Alphaproteobacteria bacterium]